MSKFMDAMATITGRDIVENDAPKKKVKKARTKSAPETTETTTEVEETKPAKKAKPEHTPVASANAIFAAYDYAADKDRLSADVREALKTGSLSSDLRKVLQVLFDKEAVRELVAAQGDVRPGPDETYVDFSFINTETNTDCTKVAEGLLESGSTLDTLKGFNIKLKVVRKRKLDDAVVGEGTKEDYAKVEKQLADESKKAPKTA